MRSMLCVLRLFTETSHNNTQFFTFAFTNVFLLIFLQRTTIFMTAHFADSLYTKKLRLAA